jgi:hypothetical protein
MAGQRIHEEQPPPVLCKRDKTADTFDIDDHLKHRAVALAIDADWKHRYGVIPVGDGTNHFFTLVADFQDHVIYLYDLLLQKSQVLRSNEQNICFRSNLMQIVGDALNHAMSVSEKPTWTHKIVLGPRILQIDGYNCGVIVCLIAWLTVRRGRPPTYEEIGKEKLTSKEEMEKIRVWMAYSSLHDKLWLPPEFEIWHHAMANYKDDI